MQWSDIRTFYVADGSELNFVNPERGDHISICAKLSRESLVARGWAPSDAERLAIVETIGYYYQRKGFAPGGPFKSRTEADKAAAIHYCLPARIRLFVGSACTHSQYPGFATAQISAYTSDWELGRMKHPSHWEPIGDHTYGFMEEVQVPHIKLPNGEDDWDRMDALVDEALEVIVGDLRALGYHVTIE